ncbi:MAG: hypothetical protein IKU30_08490 [Clostridia bacterium]|nr:hypothetical protein [Clostridia bacterium]
MKKIVLVLTAFLLAFSLFACDSGESEVSSTPIESSIVEASSVESSEPEISEPESNAPEISEPESDAESSVPDFEQTEPLEIVMTTDKTEYTIDEEIVLTFVANDETAELNCGQDFFVEYWDEEAKEWKDCEKDFIILEEGCSCIGKGTYTFELSERADAGYPKYRVRNRFLSNRFFANKTTGCTIYSNEFTIDG